MMNLLSAALLCLLLAVPNVSLAANARDYIPAPPGTFLFCSYFKHITANKLYKNGDKVSSDFNLSQNIGIFRPVYYTQVGPFTIDPQALILYGDAELDGEYVGGNQFSTTGFADPVVLATLWFVNDPKNKLWVGFTPYVTLPLGDYDRRRVLNLGANRWAFKPEVGMVKGFGEKFFLDLIVNGEFYTDNDDYGSASQSTRLEQDPTVGFETHLSYDITKQWFISLDYYYLYGGETTVADVNQNDTLSNHGLGLSLFWGIGSNNQLMVEYRDDFSVRIGAGTNQLTLRWAYFF